MFPISNLFEGSSIKQSLTSNLQTNVDSTREQLAAEMSINEIEYTIFDRLMTLNTKEAKCTSEKVCQMLEEYKNAVSLQKDFIEAQRRSIEDMNDITERFSVVCRAHDNHRSAQREFREIKKQIEITKEKINLEQSRNGKNLEKLNSNLQALYAKKKISADKLREAIKVFIAEKNKFNNFRIRRLRNAYIAFGEKAGNLSAQLLETYQLIFDTLNVQNDASE